MVEVFGFSSAMLSGAFSGFAGTVTMVIMYLAVGCVAWGCLYLLSFKHKVRIYKQTKSGVPVVLDTKARQYKRKQDGVMMWRFLHQIKESHTAPSHYDMSITNKGKFSAECLMSMTGGVTWIKRDINGNKSIEFSAEERQAMADEMRRAEDYKKKKIGEMVAVAMPYIAMVMILVIFMLFFNKTVEPSIALGSQLKESSEKLSVASDRLAEAYSHAYPEGINPRNNTLTGANTPGQVITSNNGQIPN